MNNTVNEVNAKGIIEKVNGESLNIVKENVLKLKEIFPEVFCEDKIDFKRLEEVLGEYTDDSDERYRFEWHGKSKAIKIAQTPSRGTLRPCKKESKNWDNTENLYIEGDNLEVLKLIQKSYQGKIKMIYIDPPYNTGNDFVYPDDYSDNLENYLKITGQKDEEGNTISSNSEGGGRYHTNWLNMMYPRLRLARNLLSDDGVIFISIDNNEIYNLRNICNEIFGEENFIEEVIWKNKYGSGAQTKGFIEVHEYILCYSKKPINTLTSELCEQERKKYVKKDEKFKKRGGYRTQPLMTKSLGDRENLKYSIVHNGVKITPNKQWVWSKERLEEAINNNDVEFKKREDGSYSVEAKKYLYDDSGNIRRGKPVSILNGPFNQDGTKENRELFNNKTPFEFIKPVQLIRDLLSLQINESEDKDFIVLDFFSGSATTAHSVMSLNSEDKGKRKFIMVQLPELTKENSEAYGLNFKNICEIGKERIRRAGDKIVQENKDKEGIEDLDIGFKVFKLDTSNIKPWNPDYYNIEMTLDDSIDNFVPDRSEEDIVYEIMLKYGIDLTYPVETREADGKKIFSIGFGALLVCLDDEITLEAVNEIVKLKKELNPETCRVVFKDNGFKTDSVKTNAVEILKRNDVKDIMSI
ncbi:site-specific DNA-methyltransferase [Clostridium butyricum]|uniref:site-specific DNA-methyltransferase n=1 Tax=Clostridium butyricum TaxID=1492 RepID=UPI00071E9FA7|nr:site-specific DNA-methyltransferase [Clostridium butyricum]ALS18379.1 DNA methylase N-4 [Clostridium butyricum]MDM8131668.1 site-specific DNA-methyltransferase [Clostridium butyricum]MDM8230364.1 site-specific DNA-methyltransferase [Clostridium butyricum]